MATILYRSNNWGEPLGTLPYLTFTHEEDVDDGTDMLTVVTRGWASKRDRLLWQDVNGDWHEHIVDAAVTERQDGVLVTTLTCSNSISELFGQSLSSTTWDGTYYGNPDGLLDTILDGTHWEMGDNDTFEGVDIEIWAKSKRQCITEICELVHGELVTEILVSGTRVVGRKVSIVHKRGDQTVKHYFAWGVNASSIRREVAADEVYTEVYGVGAPIQVDSSNYPVRYVSTVGDSSLIDDYGMVHRIPLPEEEYGTEMGEAGSYDDYTDERGHYTLMYVDDSLDTTEKLQAACTRQLRKNYQPLISYTFEFADIEGDGMAGLSLGDAVLVRDDEMGRVTTKRVTHIIRTYYGRADIGRDCSVSIRVVIGERKNNMFEQLEASEKLGQWVTGNHVTVNARESMSTNGKYDRSGSGGGGGGTGGNEPVDPPASYQLTLETGAATKDDMSSTSSANDGNGKYYYTSDTSKPLTTSKNLIISGEAATQYYEIKSQYVKILIIASIMHGDTRRVRFYCFDENYNNFHIKYVTVPRHNDMATMAGAYYFNSLKSQNLRVYDFYAVDGDTLTIDGKMTESSIGQWVREDYYTLYYYTVIG